MITVLIAAGAGVGGVLLGCGWSIWRVSARFTLQTRPVEPVKITDGAQPGDVIFAVETAHGTSAIRSGMRIPADDLAAAGISDASADYAPRHEADPLAWFRPIQEVMQRYNLNGKPVVIGYHVETYPARHSAGYDALSDYDPPDLREDRGW